MNINRRSFLKLAPAAAVVVAVPSLVVAAKPTVKPVRIEGARLEGDWKPITSDMVDARNPPIDEIGSIAWQRWFKGKLLNKAWAARL